MKALLEFLKLESAAGVLLFSAAILALILENSPAQAWYHSVLHAGFYFELGYFKFEESFSEWINHALMAIYFLLVGLEIKHEMFAGVLRSFARISLPAVGALGGILLPALIFSSLNWDNSVALRGWAIPVATDIAFSLGILALLGKRVPVSLKIFLAALAILDDIAAIVIIALFYTSTLSALFILLTVVTTLTLFVLNKAGVVRLTPYYIFGALLWIFVLKSGVHATLAGIILAFTIPLGNVKELQSSPALSMAHTLHPWATFFILPLFAFANAGLAFDEFSWAVFKETLPLGIALGLVLGKSLGIFTSCWLLIKFKLASLPEKMTLAHLYGLATLCGVGFTMSLFVGHLAFADFDSNHAQMVKLGVLTGSLISGVLGYLILSRLNKSPDKHQDKHKKE